MLSIARKKETFSVSLRDFSLRKDISLTVLSYGLPMAAGTLLMSFSSTFANRLLVLYGNEAVAAQGVAGKAGMLIAMLVMGVCMGVQPAVSYAYGGGACPKSQLGSTAAANVGCEAVLCFRQIIKQPRHKQRGIIIAASQGAGSVNCRGIRQTRKST